VEDDDDGAEELLRKAANASKEQDLEFSSKNQTPIKVEPVA
jgi:hypothetical protein